MADHPLPGPVSLSLDGEQKSIATVEEAVTLLSTGWPQDKRGPRHRDALETCLKVLDGHRSVVDAQAALGAAVEEAGLGG